MANTVTIKFIPKGNKALLKAIKKLDKATQALVKQQVQLSKSSSRLSLEHKKLQQVTQKNIVTNKKHTKGLFDTSHAARNTSGAFSVLRSKLLLFNFAMALGLRQIIKFTTSSAKVASMETAFNTLSGGSDKATKALEKLSESTRGTMSDFDLFQQANNAMILGITKNSNEMAEMFNVAMRLGKALGKDTKSSVESLITGIGRQSRLMLDNIGIIVKSDEAYKKHALALKKNVDELTDLERKQAFLNATMESAREKVANLNEDVETSQTQFERLKASSMNLASAIGDWLSPSFGLLSGAIADAFTAIDDALEKSTGIEGLERKLAFQQKLITGLEKADSGKMLKENQASINLAKKRVALLKKEIQERISKQEELDVEKERIVKLSEEEKKRAEEERKRFEANLQAQSERIAKQKELQKAEEEARKKRVEEHKNTLSAFEEINNAQKELYSQNLEFQFLQIDLQAQKFRDMKLNEKAITEFVEQAKQDAVIKNLEKTNIAYNSFLAGYDTFIRSMTDMDMHGAERRKQVLEATKNAFIGFLGEMIKEKIKQVIAEQIISKTAQATSIASAKATGTLIAGSMAIPAALASTASFGQAATAGTAGVMASVAATKALAQVNPYEAGGLVGGRRHSQGGTLIEAERGEFVMSRKAVQSIGIEAMNQINQGGGGGVIVNISGGIVDQSYVNNELIPAINKATSLGTRVNA